MVIFFDLDPSLEHGQVQLYAAPGFEAAFLSNSERQAIFENDMLPYLRAADFDGALRDRAREGRRGRDRRACRAAPDRRARSTPSWGSSVRRSCSWAWPAGRSSTGGATDKDPVYLDDPSILMPAPPPDLTAASGAMVMDGVDVAARADHRHARPCQPRPDQRSARTAGFLGIGKKVGDR